MPREGLMSSRYTRYAGVANIRCSKNISDNHSRSKNRSARNGVGINVPYPYPVLAWFHAPLLHPVVAFECDPILNLLPE
jgi:hypothetical protein